MAADQPISEQWRPVVGYEGFYEVSDQGEVRRVDRLVPHKTSGTLRLRGKVLSPGEHQHGYQYVILSKDHKSRTRMIHRLMAEAFLGVPEFPDMEVLHWDDNPRNNRLSNLRWGTRSDNRRDEIRNGRNYRTNLTHCKHGHEFTPENTSITGRGRTCRECARKRNREHEARKRAQRDA